MDNIISITKSVRLTEQEVHQAIQDLLDSGESVSSLSLLRTLGRGSLTTITKHLNSFATDHKNEAIPPKLTELPENIARSAKLMAIKIWNEAEIVASKDLEGQREALEQAARISAERIHEAEIFSEEQAKRLEEQEKSYALSVAGLRDDIEKLTADLENKSTLLNKITTELEVIKNEHQGLSNHHKETKKQLVETASLASENKSLDLQVAKQQFGLDILTKRLDEEQGLRKAESKENKALIERASILEGELKAWQAFKPR